MEKICLNFFGEKAEINVPTSLQSLRNAISKQFFFTPQDSADIIIEYIKNLKTKVIKTEEDFRTFIVEKINQINLNINEESRIYKENLKEVENKEINLKKQLDLLIKEKKTIIKKHNKKIVEGKEKLDNLKKKILLLKNEYQNILNELMSEYNKNKKEVKEKDKKINKIRKQLNLPELKEKKLIKICQKKTEEKSTDKYSKKKSEEKNIEPDISNKETNEKIQFFTKKSIELIEEKMKNINFERKNLREACQNLIKELDNWKNIDIEVQKTKNDFGQIIENVGNCKFDKNEEVVHRNYTCNRCKMNPIVGVRYECAVCDCFNYCEKCENEMGEIHNHPFIKFIKPIE